jgi:hypothetical protein
MLLINGGVNLSIKGLHRVKVFDTDSMDDVEKSIRKEFGLKDAIKGTYMIGETIVHILENERGETLFEYKEMSSLNR